MSDAEAQNWNEEAKSVINDVKDHVIDIHISPELLNNDHKIYLNLTTLENRKYCIELSANGFRVVGNDFNVINSNEDNYFETPYSLLSVLSPLFHNSFGNALLSKLSALNQD